MGVVETILMEIDESLEVIKELEYINLYGGICTHHTDKEMPYGLAKIVPENCEPSGNIISANDTYKVTAYLHLKTIKNRDFGSVRVPVAVCEVVVFTSKKITGTHAANYQAALNILGLLKKRFKDIKLIVPEGKPQHSEYELSYINIEVLMFGCAPVVVAEDQKCY